jgi:hypothetical protein
MKSPLKYHILLPSNKEEFDVSRCILGKKTKNSLRVEARMSALCLIQLDTRCRVTTNKILLSDLYRDVSLSKNQ